MNIRDAKVVLKGEEATPQDTKNNQDQQESKKQTSFMSVVGKMLGAIALGVFDLCIMVVLAFLVIFYYTYYTSVSAVELVERDISQTTIIYDASGTHELYKIHGEENRKIVGHDHISNYLRIATIIAEDDNFYNHMGIDIAGIVRSLYKNAMYGQAVQGGSTITQQLARNAFLSREKTLQRKFTETVLAIKFERHYDKDEILDLYLNEVPYGSNAYGAQTAAEIFFGKDAKDLTLDEAAMLAALPKATTYYSPYGSNIDQLVKRQQAILKRLYTRGIYDKDTINAALAVDTLAKVRPLEDSIDAPHFVFYVREELERLYGEDVVRQGGLRVYTTLNYDLQKKAEEIVTGYAAQLPQHGASNAALVAVDPRSGAVQAMVGSIGYHNETIDGEVNVTTRLRQPGSSFKPLVYAAAFEKGYQPETLLWDMPTSFGIDGSGKNYRPQNYDRRSHGLVSMRKAVAGSLNVPAVKALYLAGNDHAIDVAEKLGITSLTDRKRYGLSLVLGGGEVKLVEQVGAFATFANDGMHGKTHGITRVVTANGEEHVHTSELKRAVSAETARKINSVLSDNEARTYVFGRRNPLTIENHTVAAKTGTTQNSRDALTIGYTRDIAVGVWVGNNDGRFMRKNVLGSKVAAPLWNQFMQHVLTGKENQPFPEYQKVESETPMVAGKRPFVRTGGSVLYFDRASGEQISYEKARKRDPATVLEKHPVSAHSILYYIDINDPLKENPEVNRTASNQMLWRWEAGLRRR